MTTYEVGDVLRVAVSVKDAAGAPVNATAVTCAVALPNGTTGAASVANPATGSYVATWLATQVGNYPFRWSATGVNSGGFPFTEWVRVGVPTAPLLSVEDLQTHLQMAIPADSRESAQAACDGATAMVRAHCRSDLTTVTGWRLDALQGIAKGVAADLFGNPRDLSSYAGPEGLNFSAAPRTRRTLFDSEKAVLDGIMGRGSRVGSIRMGIAPWMTPDPDAD